MPYETALGTNSDNPAACLYCVIAECPSAFMVRVLSGLLDLEFASRSLGPLLLACDDDEDVKCPDSSASY